MTADQDVENAGNGGTSAGAFSYALAAMLYEANMFGLSKDYAYPEGSNVSAARWDQITTVAKLLTRKQKFADGNEYDIWDAVMTIAKSVVKADPHINDDEVNSVNYKAPAAS